MFYLIEIDIIVLRNRRQYKCKEKVFSVSTVKYYKRGLIGKLGCHLCKMLHNEKTNESSNINYYIDKIGY